MRMSRETSMLLLRMYRSSWAIKVQFPGQVTWLLLTTLHGWNGCQTRNSKTSFRWLEVQQQSKTPLEPQPAYLAAPSSNTWTTRRCRNNWTFQVTSKNSGTCASGAKVSSMKWIRQHRSGSTKSWRDLGFKCSSTQVMMTWLFRPWEQRNGWTEWTGMWAESGRSTTSATCKLLATCSSTMTASSLSWQFTTPAIWFHWIRGRNPII